MAESLIEMVMQRYQADQGWQRAIDKIAERASLTKGPDTRR